MTPPLHGFSAHVAERNVPAARVACLLVAGLMPLGILLDVVTEPSHALDFVKLRLLSSFVCFAVLGLTYTPLGKRNAFWIGAAPAFVAAAAISVMIQRLGGYASPYYAGLSLCILGIGLVFYWTAQQAALVCSIIVGIWLFPTLVSSRRVEVGPFFNNSYFLVLTAVIAVASNAIRFRLARREFEAQTKLARATVELSAAVGKLQQVDRAKSRFFANVSHELRTPLTLILAPVEHLLEVAPDGMPRRELHVIRNNASRLLRLIDELLDLSRLDAGGLRLNVSEVDFRALVQAILDDSGALARRKLIDLSFEGPPSARVFGDAHRLESILSNLVGNALKYTPEGGRVRVALRDGPVDVELDVEDDGPGIAAEDLPRVFERFFQAVGHDRRREGGVGIGLALAKELADLHGGELSVRSESGRGTTFSLTLPKGRDHFRPEVIERRSSLAPAAPGRRVDDLIADADSVTPVPEAPSAPVVDTRLGGRRILVVEDHDALRSFVAALLSEEHTVIEATDGESGFEIVKREHPDLVLSDVMMPGGSGTDLCARIKRDPALRDIPVVLLTARVGSEATLDAYAHGADDFVAKPFHPRVLVARVRAQLRLRALGLELASREKLAVVGTLAAGVAHEVRNPLNALSNAASLLLERELPRDTVRKLLLVVSDAAERIRLVVSALDSHARPAEAGGITACDVTEGIEATLRLVEYRLTGVSVVRDFATKRSALVSAGAVNQVFLNLVDNALRAGAKKLEIGVRDESSDVVVTISDDGPGIPSDIAERIFDPFFTTRAPGEGTGLGLYLARKMMKEQGGELRLVRHVGGAEFEMRLPATAPVRRSSQPNEIRADTS